MRFNNFAFVTERIRRVEPPSCLDAVTVHKSAAPPSPRVSFILLDWDCRERFHTLDWLEQQDVPRDTYEILWVELYSRCMPQPMKKADIVVACNQRGMYHKHKGYNVGFLLSRGDIVIICDSDAVFPPHFVRSGLERYGLMQGDSAHPIGLMFHELRTSYTYPDGLADTAELADAKWQWWPLTPNAGACACYRREDIIRFGGFDEDESYRGYICGPYDLTWRLANAGIPEVWHHLDTVLWHFAHPDPVASNGFLPDRKRIFESVHPHVDMHALTAVEALSTGRLLPLQENHDIWKLRRTGVRTGTEFEEKYAHMTGPEGFSRALVWRIRLDMFVGRFALFFSRHWQALRARAANRNKRG